MTRDRWLSAWALASVGLGAVLGGWLAGAGGFDRALGVSGLLVVLGSTVVWWLRGRGSLESMPRPDQESASRS